MIENIQKLMSDAEPQIWKVCRMPIKMSDRKTTCRFIMFKPNFKEKGEILQEDRGIKYFLRQTETGEFVACKPALKAMVGDVL